MRYEIAKPTAKVPYYLLIEHRPSGDAVWIRSARGHGPFVRSLLDAVKVAANNLVITDPDPSIAGHLDGIAGHLDDIAALYALVAAFVREGVSS